MPAPCVHRTGGDGDSLARTRRGQRQKTKQTIPIGVQAVFAKMVSGARTNDSRSILRALFASERAQVDPQLLRLLIQVTALEAKSFCSQAHVLVSALQFSQNRFSLE